MSMLSLRSSAVARLAARSRRPVAAAATALRRLGMQVREAEEELPSNFSMDAIQPPPHGFGEPYEDEKDPMAYVRAPVTSAHAIDLARGEGGALSALDSAAFGPGGAVVHGRYGAVDAAAAQTVPLEYLALLRPAAEGAAALRDLGAGTGTGLGTVLVYGASRPAGTTAVQLAAAAGHAVVAVVDGQHSGNDEMVDIVKGLTSEPGTAVSEEYALCKANFRDLVDKTVAGDDFTSFRAGDADPDQLPHRFLADFKKNVLDYVEYYPSDLPAAVDAEQFKFVGKEKDRANFKTNMEAYLSQYAPGADPIDPAQLEANFTLEQYGHFKKKFAVQTTAVISGGPAADDAETNTDRFAPAELVRNMAAQPESPPADDAPEAGDYPFEFSTKRGPPPLTPTLAGGPLLGAVVEVTPDLAAACAAVAEAPTLRGKAEALQMLTEAQRGAHAAAASVVGLARRAGAPVRTVGGALPGLDEAPPPTDADVRTALEAMDIGDDGTSKLNYFIQVYRAGDWPVYEAYAIHRAKEPLSGPRQIVVTK